LKKMSYEPVNDAPPPSATNNGTTQNAVVEHLKTGVGHVSKWLEVNDVQKVAQEVSVETFHKYKGYVSKSDDQTSQSSFQRTRPVPMSCVDNTT